MQFGREWTTFAVRFREVSGLESFRLERDDCKTKQPNIPDNVASTNISFCKDAPVNTKPAQQNFVRRNAPPRTFGVHQPSKGHRCHDITHSRPHTDQQKVFILPAKHCLARSLYGTPRIPKRVVQSAEAREHAQDVPAAAVNSQLTPSGIYQRVGLRSNCIVHSFRQSGDLVLRAPPPRV